MTKPVKEASTGKKKGRAVKPSDPSAPAEQNGAAAAGSPTTRSQHLQKLLALREKVKKPAEPAKAPARQNGTPKAPAAPPAARAASPVVSPAPPAPATEEGESEAEKRQARRKKKAPYSKADLKELKGLLLEERERLIRDLRQLDDLADSNRQATHATFSSHQADAASDFSSLESTYIQRHYESERFAQVSEALRRLDDNTYGACEMCMDEPQNLCATCPYIPVDRLRAKPFARMCVQLKIQMEKKNRR